MLLRLILLFIGVGVASSIFSQNIIPEGFSFQSIARDGSGNIAPNRVVYIQAEILRGGTTSASVYSEIHQTTTTFEGIFNIVIGSGSLPSASFSSIKWSDAPYSLKIKIAVTPLNVASTWKYQDALMDAGTVQLLSVPYAKVAGNGVDSTKVFFLRDTTSVLSGYVKKEAMAGKLNVADSLLGYVTPNQLKRNGGGVSYDTAQMLSGYARKGNVVTSVAIDSLNGVSGTVKNPFSTPSISINLGNITPVSVTSGKGIFDSLKATYVAADTIKGTLVTGAQPFITSVGQLTNLTVNGVINGGIFSGTLNAAAANSITSLANLAAITVSGNTTSNTLSVVKGTIGNLSVPGIITAGSLNVTSANLTNITGLNALTLTGNLTSNTLSTVGGTIGNLSVPGTFTTGNINAGNATLSSITGLNALTLTGNLTANTLSTVGGTIGNLSVPGTLTTGNVNATSANLGNITGLNALTLTGNLTANSLTAGNATLSSITGLNALTLTGNLTANTLSTVGGTIGNLSVPGTLTTGNVNATSANLTNITGLNALTLTGNLSANSLTAGNANLTSITGLNALTLTGNLTANTLSSSAATLGNVTVGGTITAGMLSGTLTGTLQSAAQPNITSVGQLSNLSVIGTVNAGTLSGILSAGTQSNITGVGNLTLLTVTGNISSATISSVIVTPEQPNITKLGNLSSLSVAGTAQANVLSATTVNTTNLAGLRSLTVNGTIEAMGLTVSGNITTATINAGNATLTGISGLSLPTGTLSDTFVTISGGVLKQTVFVPTAATFAADFTVTGVANYLKWVDGERVPAKNLTAVQLLELGAVKAIHPTYSAPTVSIGAAPSGGNVEIGSTIAVTLSNTFTQNDGGTATTTTYKKNGTGMGGNTDNLTNLTTAVSYSVSVDYGQGACKNDNLGAQDCTGRIAAGTANSGSVTYTPLAKRYWGYASSNAPTDTDIRNASGGGSELSGSKAKSSFGITPPSANYIFFAYPASLGTLSSISVGGFESISAFTLTARTVVNASGYSQTYNIYVSNNTFSSVVTGIITN